VNVLLDTCTFLWVITDAPELSRTARAAFRDPGNDVYLSAVSTWEIALKNALGKLALPQLPEHYIPAQRRAHAILPLPLDEDATLALRRLPDLHRDPFDRMLVCQALTSDMTVLTPDPLITAYPARTLW
jgi:PIN domain nuclease of toxin-antitoxin system